MSYYSDEDEIDIHVRRGRASPVYDARPRRAPQYYSQRETRLEVAGGRYERSRSRGYYREIERERPRERERERPVTPQPIIINNRIENHQEEDEYNREDRYLALAAPVRTRSRSRHRESVSNEPGYMSREDYELERTRKELERYKLEKQHEEDEKMMKKELELKRLREEKKAEEEKKEKKEAEERAIKEYKAKEAEKAAKEKKEKEEREAEYKKRLEEDLRKSGMDDRQIAVVLKKEKDGSADPNRPTYTRMARRYLSIETLRELRIDYTLDTVRSSLLTCGALTNASQDPDYILIKRWVPEYEQDFLWNHTRELREVRDRQRQPIVLAIEEKKHKHHNHKDDEFEIVRKHKRKTSPSPLVTFFAGGKR
jgi:hypothetical protein